LAHLETGKNVLANCAEAAGQTVMHSHVHPISRRMMDVAGPRCGVRALIPGMATYGT
jgi:diadenosine tetraphosphate (Ap4A) HIT family hydrolase